MKIRDIALCALALSALIAVLPAQAEVAGNGLVVTVPNGYANVAVDDLHVMSTAGVVRWTRHWDGQEWKFNPQWESLSQSWKNLTGSQSASSTGGTSGASVASSGGNGGGCWVWVDDDWQPSTGTVVVGGLPQSGPLLALRTTPFNRLMGEDGSDYAPPQRVNVDYATLCMGVQGATTRDAEAIRKSNELYLGEAGRYAFNNRTILEKRAVRQLPSASAATLYASLATGSIAAVSENNLKGYRWIDRAGDWIDYNTQGQVVAWGDKNNNTVWMVRDLDGILLGVADANGHVLYSLHYTGELITEIRDYGMNSGDPGRSVKYRYDEKNRLTQVTDARGNGMSYDYDGGNHIVQITDAEARIEKLEYNGDVVKRRTAPDDTVTDYEFDYDDVNKQFVSKIIGPETPAGRRVEDYTHNRTGKLVRAVVNGRTEQEVRYDTAARARIITNARGFTTRVTANEFDQIVEASFTDGSGFRRIYSALHLGLIEEIDELDVKTQYLYDEKGNITKKTEAAGSIDARVTDYARNALGQVFTMTKRGRTEINGTVTPDSIWQFEYDTIGQLNKATDPETNVWLYSYDHGGRLVKFTNPRGHAIGYDVDPNGNVSKMRDALSRTNEYLYDKVGNLTQTTDARAKVLRAAYDKMNRLVQGTNAVLGIYKLEYTAQGQVKTEIDEDGKISLAEYDNFLMPKKQSDALNNVTRFDYHVADGSEAGLLGSLAQATEVVFPTFTLQTRFDSRERPTSYSIKNSNSVGLETLVNSYGYDKRGQVTSERDANGNNRTRNYNAFGQDVEHVDALLGKTKSSYDARGNLLLLTDAKGNAYSFEYDRNDRLTKETLPMGQFGRYAYDIAGNVIEKIDFLGNKYSVTYDAANRITEMKHYKGDGSLQRSTTLTWDANDNLKGWNDTDHMSNQSSSSSATFDDANRKTSEAVTYPGGDTLNYGYGYSAAGRKTQLTWPDGTQITYGYSLHGMLESVTIPGEGVIKVNRYKWTASEHTALPGGGMEERTYDGVLSMENFKVKSPSQQSVLELSQEYGKIRELTSRIRTDTTDNISRTQSNSYRYDKEDRLTVVITDGDGTFSNDTEGFTLDAVANRIAHTRQGGEWIYDANNRLIRRGSGACGASGSVCYEYDLVGNLSRQIEGTKVRQYGYNSSNRLVEVKDGEGQLFSKYGYDPLGRRLWKEQFRDKDGTSLALPRRTYFLYGDEGLIAEASQNITLNADQTVTSNGSPAITTQYGPRPDAFFGTGNLFVKTKNSNGQDVFAYFHHDHLETPIQATDKLGNVIWAARYDPFGGANIITPAATAEKPVISSNLRFPGQYEDPETGLHYNYFRDYDPQVGRYLQMDPIGLEGGMNSYAYAAGNPLNYVDPEGLVFFVPMVIGGVLGGLSDAGIQLIMNGGNIACINWGQVALGAGLGAAGGGLGALTRIKRVGTEWSHAGPDRWLRPRTLSGKNVNPDYKPYLDVRGVRDFMNGSMNGNYVSPRTHALTDPYRNLRGMKKTDKLPPAIRYPLRTPAWLTGSVVGSAGGVGYSAINNCECER